jgi:chromosome segregation ATPase
MSLKSFFKIPEANAEIARLTTELTNKDTAHASVLETKSTELATAISERDTARTELATAQTNLTTVTTELDTAKAELGKATAKIAELEGKQTTVEKKAAEIASTVGNPKPVEAESANSEQKSKEQLYAEFAAITDPTKKREFWVANKLAMTGRK